MPCDYVPEGTKNISPLSGKVSHQVRAHLMSEYSVPFHRKPKIASFNHNNPI